MRTEIDAKGAKTKIGIQRYLCKTKNRTFSLLPERLTPYRAPCLPLLSGIWRSMLFPGKSHQEILANITNAFSGTVIANWEYSRCSDLLSILEKAMDRFVAIGGHVFLAATDFFNYCESYWYKGRVGFLAIAQSFHDEHQRFLFGTASQHR
jgi:hypothetical protein